MIGSRQTTFAARVMLLTVTLGLAALVGGAVASGRLSVVVLAVGSGALVLLCLAAFAARIVDLSEAAVALSISCLALQAGYGGAMLLRAWSESAPGAPDGEQVPRWPAQVSGPKRGAPASRGTRTAV